LIRSDGEILRGKGRQFLPHGTVAQMAFPGGAGYGKPEERAKADIRRDLALGYISAEQAANIYNMAQTEIDEVLKAASAGKVF